MPQSREKEEKELSSGGGGDSNTSTHPKSHFVTRLSSSRVCVYVLKIGLGSADVRKPGDVGTPVFAPGPTIRGQGVRVPLWVQPRPSLILSLCALQGPRFLGPPREPARARAEDRGADG